MILNEFFNLPQVFEKDMTEGSSQHTDMTVAQQVFKDNPNIDHEDDILNAAFPYVVELVGSRKRANYMFNYDEDFPSDLISAYRYLQRDQHDVGLEEDLNEFATGGAGDSGDYFRELASAWYNGAYDSGSLEKGIKTNQDIERLLQRGIVAPDGKTRKYNIDYNSDFDGVIIFSDDYYEHGDHDDTIDSRTGQKWGPYDYMEFSDDELSEGVGQNVWNAVKKSFTPDPNWQRRAGQHAGHMAAGATAAGAHGHAVGHAMADTGVAEGLEDLRAKLDLYNEKAFEAGHRHDDQAWRKYTKLAKQIADQLGLKYKVTGYGLEIIEQGVAEDQLLDESLDGVAQWIKNKFDKAVYVAKSEGRELGRAVQTVANWSKATPDQKAQAKEDLIDIGQFVLSLVAAAGVGGTAAAAVPTVAAHAAAGGTAAEVATEAIKHIVGDLGIEGIAAVLGVAGLQEIKKAIHHATTTSSGVRYDQVMGKRLQRQQASPTNKQPSQVDKLYQQHQAGYGGMTEQQLKENMLDNMIKPLQIKLGDWLLKNHPDLVAAIKQQVGDNPTPKTIQQALGINSSDIKNTVARAQGNQQVNEYWGQKGDSLKLNLMNAVANGIMVFGVLDMLHSAPLSGHLPGMVQAIWYMISGALLYATAKSGGMTADVRGKNDTPYQQDPMVKKLHDKSQQDQALRKQSMAEAKAAATASFRAGYKKRAELSAMTPDERRAYDQEQQEKQRKRDDARLERERQKNAAKRGTAEGAPVTAAPGSVNPGGAVDNFKQQMANNTQVKYQKNLVGVAEGPITDKVKKGVAAAAMVGLGATAMNPDNYSHKNPTPNQLKSQQQSIQKSKNKGQQGVAEGMFDRQPNPVLPIVDKIAKVAGGLTPQNVEVGKQIIQANARDIIRMLSPQAKAGVDVIEAKDDYVPPKEADYGDKYQAMVKRVGQKAKQQEKARQQQQPKQPVRESRRALLRQIIQS